MNDTPDLRTLATVAAHDVDCPDGPNCREDLTTYGRYGRYADAVLAAVLPAHRRQVLDQAADACSAREDEANQTYCRDLAFGPGTPSVRESPARPRTWRAAKELLRELASAAPETAPRPRQDDETAPAVPEATPAPAEGDTALGTDQIPEQVYLDAARAEATVVSATAIPGDPEWVDGLVEQFARRPEFRAGVASAYRAGQAAVPDGAEQVVQHRLVMGTIEGTWADISDEDAARQIAETQGLGVPPWRMERRVVSIGPAEVIGHGGRSTGAVAADGQDGDGHG